MKLPVFVRWPADNPPPWTGVWIEAVGHRDCQRYTANDNPDFFCIHLITNGKLLFQSGNLQPVILKKNYLFSIWPGVKCRFEAVPPWKPHEVLMDWIRIKGPLAREFMYALGTTEDHPYTRAVKPDEVCRVLRKLQVLAVKYPPEADCIAVSLLYYLASVCTHHQPEVSRTLPLALRIREAMEEHLAYGLNIKAIATTFRISRSKLFQEFKKIFGKSPLEVMENIRMQNARKLLESTEMSVKEIALSSGYKDPLYFSKRFKNKYGVPPSEFRKYRKRK